MSDRPIDLGKLQSALDKARADHGKRYSAMMAAQRTRVSAENAESRAKRQYEESVKAMQAAQEAVLAGARTVSGG